MTGTILWSLLGGIVVGVVLILTGWRGKRLNDHPICRSCGFDLLGVLPDGITCPECGAGLKRPNACRIGERRKRWVAIWVGIAAVLLPAAMIGTVGFGILTGKDFNEYKPTGLLIWEGKHLGAAVGGKAAAELERRSSKRGADKELIATIAAAALDIQGDPRRPWDEKWGDIIENALLTKILDDQDKQRYYDQAVVLAFEARPRVPAGGGLPVAAILKESRVGSGSMLWMQVRLAEATLDGRAIEPTKLTGVQFFGASPGARMIGWFQAIGSTFGRGAVGSAVPAVVMLQVPADIELGPHRVRVSLTMLTQDQSQMMAAGSVAWDSEPDPDAHRYVYDFEIEVVPKGAATAREVAATAEMTTRLEDALAVARIDIYDSGPLSGRTGNITITYPDLPVDLACDVFVKDGEREWKFGVFTNGTFVSDGPSSMYWNQNGSSATLGGDLSKLRGDEVDLILRPSASVAQNTTDVELYYGGELVISDVAVNDYASMQGFGGSADGFGSLLGSLLRLFIPLGNEQGESEPDADKPEPDKPEPDDP